MWEEIALSFRDFPHSSFAFATIIPSQSSQCWPFFSPTTGISSHLSPSPSVLAWTLSYVFTLMLIVLLLLVLRVERGKSSQWQSSFPMVVPWGRIISSLANPKLKSSVLVESICNSLGSAREEKILKIDFQTFIRHAKVYFSQDSAAIVLLCFSSGWGLRRDRSSISISVREGWRDEIYGVFTRLRPAQRLSNDLFVNNQ